MAWKKGGFTFTPYGYINISASYESQKSAVGDFCIYSVSPDIDGSNAFFIDPRSTRLGMRIDGPGIAGWRGSASRGVVEIDFQGNYTIRNRGSLLLRKAFVEVFDKNTKFLAGQDWEIISPLYPATLNYTAGAAVGNPGYRRAQLRVDHKFDLSRHRNILAQFALTDNVLRDGFNVSGVTPNVGNWPIIEGRLAYAFGENVFAHGKQVVLGTSAHIGEQQFDYTDLGIRRTKPYRTWSFNLDADVPITSRLKLQAEYFIGENLGSFEGGILQGIDLVTRRTVRAQGGWLDLQYQWTPKLQTNVCYMLDDPFNQDLVGGNAANGLSRNYSHCLFVNFLYHWTPALMTGLEVSLWRTHWQKYDQQATTVTALRPGETLRYEFVVRYTF